MVKKVAKHELIDGVLVGTDDGIVARCKCGWTSGPRFSSFVASVAFMEHEDEPDVDSE
jgi:hypothetical protein